MQITIHKQTLYFLSSNTRKTLVRHDADSVIQVTENAQLDK